MNEKIDIDAFSLKLKLDERRNTDWVADVRELVAHIQQIGVRDIEYAVEGYMTGSERFEAMQGRLYEEIWEALERFSHDPDIKATLAILESLQRADAQDEDGLFHRALNEATETT